MVVPAASAPGLSGNRARRQPGARGIHSRHADVTIKLGLSWSRLVPEIDADASGSPHGLLDWRVGHRHVAPDQGVRCGREDDDAVRVADRGVFLDEVVRAVQDPDPEIVVRRCEAVSACLVPTERVIVSDNSYPAAG